MKTKSLTYIAIDKDERQEWGLIRCKDKIDIDQDKNEIDFAKKEDHKPQE